MGSNTSAQWLPLALALAVPASATTFVVTNTNDTGPGSLRRAISYANVASGADSIHFIISGGGPHTIRPSSSLPEITDPVVIDGYTQPGALPATPTDPARLMIELDGSLTGTSGLHISAGSSTIRGLAINRFGDNYGEAGIVLSEHGGNSIAGNYIGTDVTGTVDLGNWDYGIWVLHTSTNNMIGGPTQASRNVISGNLGGGIYMDSPGNTVQSNYIGVGADGTTEFTSYYGIVMYLAAANNNTIGGSISTHGNIIMNHYKAGIVNVDGSDTVVRWNTIAYNDEYGVNIMFGIHNEILFNSIHDNWPLGIGLGWDDGVDENDPGDGDTGANTRQNYPVLLSALTEGATTTVHGVLNSTPSMAFRLQIFANTFPHPLGYGEGETWIDSITVATDEGGDAEFSASVSPPLPEGHWVTATATDPDGNTSEFCLAIQSQIAQTMNLSCDLTAGDVVFTWTEIPGAPGYWVYGASNDPWFTPDMSPPTFVNRLAVMPAGITTWSTSNGIGDPGSNWTYLVIAVNASGQEIIRSTYCGECDFQVDIP